MDRHNECQPLRPSTGASSSTMVGALSASSRLRTALSSVVSRGAFSVDALTTPVLYERPHPSGISASQGSKDVESGMAQGSMALRTKGTSSTDR